MVTEQAWNVKDIIEGQICMSGKAPPLLLYFRPVGGSRETLIKLQSQIL